MVQTNQRLFQKYTECKNCNSKTSLKSYYEKKDNLSNQRKICYEKTGDVLLAKSKVNQQNRKYKKNV